MFWEVEIACSLLDGGLVGEVLKLWGCRIAESLADHYLTKAVLAEPGGGVGGVSIKKGPFYRKWGLEWC